MRFVARDTIWKMPWSSTKVRSNVASDMELFTRRKYVMICRRSALVDMLHVVLVDRFARIDYG